MWIKKCDICKKEIKDTKTMINISYGGFMGGSKEFCFNCGKKRLSKLGLKEITKAK